MKKRSIKFLSIALSFFMIANNAITSFSYNVDANNNSLESIEYQNTEDENFTNSANVFALLASEYKVTIPKVVVLSGTSKAASYYVNVTGDIAGYEKITVTPDDNFKLYASGKDSQEATINQDKTIWTVHDFNTDANGTISADGITAGKWTGAFNFNINFESDDTSIQLDEKVLGDLIVPDIKEWNGQTLENTYTMNVGDIGVIEAINENEDVSTKLTITSSNEDVVAIKDNNLKAIDVGLSTITTVYEDKSFSVKIKVIKPENQEHTHIAASPVKENEIAVTYDKEGSYDEVTYCTDCGEELSRIQKTIPIGGLFDENNNLIKSWDELVELGLDIEKDYTNSSSDALYYKSNPSSGYSVFTNNNLSGKLIIPNSITNISNRAFRDCASLTSVTIPDSVTSIGAAAFDSCISLTSVTIPNSVTNIGNSAFDSCTSLTSVTIPDSVTSIGIAAFYKTGLKSVTIPDSVTSIAERTFSSCTSLESVTIPNSVTSIGRQAFGYCSSLKSVTIPDSVTSIDGYVFYNCSSLESVIIPDSVTSIGSSAFYNCTSLTQVTMPDSITSIGNNAFYNVPAIFEANLPNLENLGSHAFYNTGITKFISSDKLVTIDAGAFSFCASLESVILSNSIININTSTFFGCTSLTQITIPDSVTSIGDNVFQGCTSLESITIPNSVTSIGERAFMSCTSLKSITIPESVINIGRHAFYDCTSLESITFEDPYNWYMTTTKNGTNETGTYRVLTVPKTNATYFKSTYNSRYWYKQIDETIGGLYDENNNLVKTWDELVELGLDINKDYNYSTYKTESTSGYSVFKNNNLSGKLVIPNSVDIIKFNVFYGCDTLQEVTIPSSVTLIGQTAFANCQSLMAINVNPNNLNYYSIDGVLFKKANNILNTCPAGKENFDVPNTTKAIGDFAFYYCKNLKSVTIPDSVTSIGYNAFAYCTSLESVIIPDSVTSIGMQAFMGCTSLTSVTIPDTVTSIGGSAFMNCTSLKSITIPDLVTNIGNSTFSSCTSLTSVTIPNSITSIGSSAFYNVPANFEINLPNLENLGLAAFYKSGITKFVSGNKLTNIGNNTFRECTSLKSVTIPDSVTSIGNYVFYKSTSLTSVTIPDSITSIGSGAFYEVPANFEVNLPNLGNLGVAAFYNSGITKFVSGNKLTNIGNNTFNNCTSLTSVVIPDSVTSIGDTAFYNVPANFEANLPNLENLGAGAFYNSGITKFVSSDKLTNIGTASFWEATKLTYVDISNSTITKLGSIGDEETGYEYGAFGNCSSLSTVLLPNTITIIGDFAFVNDTNLKTITLPTSLERIGGNAFFNTKLTSIVIPASVKEIGFACFSNETGIKTMTTATFENPTGWYYTPTQYATSGTNLTLTNPTTNATYLMGNTTTINAWWYRK